jgi:acyl-CoA thioesterase-2
LTAATLVESITLEAVGAGRFRSAFAPAGPHVFGGLLVAQALRAAHATVGDEREAHALHAAFVRAGVGGEVVEHEVEDTRDGGSFAIRRVASRQAGTTVLVLTAHFQAPEEGADYQTPAPADVPGPGGLDTGRYDSQWFESRDVPPGEGPPHARRAWFHARGELPDDPVLHQHVLAFLSDTGPTRAARQPHAEGFDDGQRLSVSLDHSVWFHRPARADQWLLSDLVPVSTGRGRGLAVGTIRDRAGTLLVTIAQEVLLRTRRT